MFVSSEAFVASEAPDPSSLPGMGNGLLGFIVTAGLVVAIVVLYRSMRTQMKKIDFDPDGTTDAERMHGPGKSERTDDDALNSEANGHHGRPPQV